VYHYYGDIVSAEAVAVDDYEYDDDRLIAYSRLACTVEQGHIQGLLVNGSSAGLGVSGGGGGVINIRAGTTLRIDLQISGSPTPTVMWHKDHSPVSLSDRVRQLLLI